MIKKWELTKESCSSTIQKKKPDVNRSTALPKRNMEPETECLQNVLISEYGPAVQMSNC